MKKLLLAGLLLSAAPAFGQMQPPPPSQAELRAKEAKELEGLPATVEALDAKNGFRQYKLGTPVADYPTLKLRTKNMYVAPSEVLTVGDVKLMSLGFSAYKDKLAVVMFSAMGEANCDKLLEILTAQYGQGKDAGYQKLAWVGQKATMTFEKKTSTASYSGLYSRPATGVYCVVYIASNALVAEMNSEQNAAAKKAAGDL